MSFIVKYEETDDCSPSLVSNSKINEDNKPNGSNTFIWSLEYLVSLSSEIVRTVSAVLVCFGTWYGDKVLVVALDIRYMFNIFLFSSISDDLYICVFVGSITADVSFVSVTK